MTKDTEIARYLLLHHMEYLSKEFWCAGWLQNLEVDLWRMATGTSPIEVWEMPVPQLDIDTFKYLVDRARGCWVWQDGQHPTFVTKSKYLKLCEGKEGTYESAVRREAVQVEVSSVLDDLFSDETK